ncbi:MAG: hypothetical protein H0W66_03765, partial [Chthoniobacterales bacterium]|nr:hypothetical protein [Chthoniobacterales bacterium]
MNKQRRYEKLILLMELLGFGGVLLLIWLDEYVDIPFRYLGALPTPPRPQEYWFETVAVLLLAVAIVSATLWIFRRLRFLEDFIRVCAWCRKVEVADQWVTFEDYMKLQHDVKATHGICPACRANASKRSST